MSASLVDEKTPFRGRLLRWYRKNARDLPWRSVTDPYQIWISEILLQQTRVDQGLPYYERFVRAFPTVEHLARAKQDEVLKYWEGLGYYSRARNLHEAARVVVRERDARLPETAEDWQSLPGIGRYTAGAIASIAFGQRVPVLDGNVKRVLARLLDLKKDINAPATEASLWKLMDMLVQGRSPGDFNQAMMELGAMICTPRNPRCGDCPVTSHCSALAAGTQLKRPVRKAKKRTPHHEIVIAVIKRNGRYLIGKRPPDGLLGGLWEFPGGKVKRGEDHCVALAREIREELGVRVTIGEQFATVQHAYSHFRVTLSVYRCELTRGTPKAKVHTDLKWIHRKRLSDYAFPKANHKFMDQL